MNVTIDKIVNYQVKSVAVESLNVMKLKNNKLIFSVPYKWLDAEGKVIRTGSNLYKQEELEVSMAGQIAMLNALVAGFNSLMAVNENCKTISFYFRDSCSAVANYPTIVNEKTKWMTTKYTEAQVETKLVEAESSVAILKAIISGFTTQIFAND